MLNLLMAWRNIWRNPRRTILTLLAISFSCAVLVFFRTLQYSAFASSINAAVGIFHGHLQVQTEGYLDKPQVQHTIYQAERLTQRIKQLPGVKAAGPRAFSFAMVSSADRTYGVQVAGVEPTAERQISSIPGLVKEGRYLSNNSALEAVLGVKLAANLRVKVGDELTMLGQARDGSLAATIVPVVGIFKSGAQDLDRSFVQIPLGAFQENFAMSEKDQAHIIAVVGNELELLPQLSIDISTILKSEIVDLQKYPLIVQPWDKIIAGLKESIELDLAASGLFFLSLIVIVTFSIFNTFLMAMLERKRELGIMIALGKRPINVSFLLILESFILSSIGVLAGISLGSLVVTYFGHYGFTIPSGEELAKMWNLPGTIYMKHSLRALTIPPGLIFFATLLSSAIPAFRAKDIKPVEVLKIN